VDLLVLVDDASWDGTPRVHAAFDHSARALDVELAAVYFSVHVKTPECLVERRAIAGLCGGPSCSLSASPGSGT